MGRNRCRHTGVRSKRQGACDITAASRTRKSLDRQSRGQPSARQPARYRRGRDTHYNPTHHLRPKTQYTPGHNAPQIARPRLNQKRRAISTRP